MSRSRACEPAALFLSHEAAAQEPRPSVNQKRKHRNDKNLSLHEYTLLWPVATISSVRLRS